MIAANYSELRTDLKNYLDNFKKIDWIYTSYYNAKRINYIYRGTAKVVSLFFYWL